MDNRTPSQRSAVMARVPQKNTKPELAVRRMLHRAGFRYRLHRRDLPGVPDLVFPARRKVVFVHGCFWHGHADPACKLARTPKSRYEFWTGKVAYNRERDSRHIERLAAMGWFAIVVWECELKNRDGLMRRLTDFLEGELAT